MPEELKQQICEILQSTWLGAFCPPEGLNKCIWVVYFSQAFIPIWDYEFVIKMANWNFIYSICYLIHELHCHKLVAAWMRILWTFVSWVLANIMTELPVASRNSRIQDIDFLQWLARTFGQIIFVLLYTQHWVLMNSLGRHGNLSLVSVMKKVMVSHITLWNWATFIRLWLHSVVVLPSNCYCADFSAIS